MPTGRRAGEPIELPAQVPGSLRLSFAAQGYRVVFDADITVHSSCGFQPLGQHPRDMLWLLERGEMATFGYGEKARGRDAVCDFSRSVGRCRLVAITNQDKGGHRIAERSDRESGRVMIAVCWRMNASGPVSSAMRCTIRRKTSSLRRERCTQTGNS